MPLARRKLFLSFAVSLATLASVAAIVPRNFQPGARLSSTELSPQQPQQQPSPVSVSMATTSVEARRAAEAVMTAATDETQPAAAAEGVPAAETGEAAPAFAEAAAQQNRSLRDGLRWTFGGKQQRGWAIYVPLIQRLIDTEEDAASAGFAARLARWQKSAGLNASGVLDEATLMRMISTWQSRRRRGSTYPQPDQLFTVPPAEFWDSSRADDLRKVERQTYAAYKRMLAAAIGDSSLQLASKNGELAASEKFFKIISAFRSREYQDRLRKLEPGAGRAALAVNSPHFTGRALDLYVGGEPTITKDSNRLLQTQTRAYRWLVRNAERFGFCPYFFEPWHWEYCAP
ncbi:MAG TPA: D-alanyl-D-alanine carboxypeptidase family protein [Pyrinomonadaceae bacterium]|nr:D-alanyl-D-alanine carboxypeptidase family protein [Pyrinomonadaceae bacterium]